MDISSQALQDQDNKISLCNIVYYILYFHSYTAKVWEVTLQCLPSRNPRKTKERKENCVMIIIAVY